MPGELVRPTQTDYHELSQKLFMSQVQHHSFLRNLFNSRIFGDGTLAWFSQPVPCTPELRTRLEHTGKGSPLNVEIETILTRSRSRWRSVFTEKHCDVTPHRKGRINNVGENKITSREKYWFLRTSKTEHVAMVGKLALHTYIFNIVSEVEIQFFSRNSQTYRKNI